MKQSKTCQDYRVDYGDHSTWTWCQRTRLPVCCAGNKKYCPHGQKERKA